MNKQTTNSPDGDIPISKTRVRIITALGILSLLLPTVLSNAEPVYAIEHAPVPYRADHGNIFAPEFPTDWDPLLIEILSTEADRLGITDPSWVDRTDLFIDMVKDIESNGRRTAYNPSGAMSYFQFKGPSIETAYNRLINYMQRNDLGRTPGWSKYLANNPQSIYNTSSSRQAVFMMVNIIEQDRETGLFAAFLSGNTEAAKEAYYRYHHTNPDRPTIIRTQQKFNHYFK